MDNQNNIEQKKESNTFRELKEKTKKTEKELELLMGELEKQESEESLTKLKEEAYFKKAEEYTESVKSPKRKRLPKNMKEYLQEKEKDLGDIMDNMFNNNIESSKKREDEILTIYKEKLIKLRNELSIAEKANDEKTVLEIENQIRKLEKKQKITTPEANKTTKDLNNDEKPDEKSIPKEELWTNKDEAELNSRLNSIENAKKRLAEIDAELERIKKEEEKKDQKINREKKKNPVVLETKPATEEQTGLGSSVTKPEIKPIIEKQKEFCYSMDFVKKEIEKLLSNKKGIEKIKYININGDGDKINIKSEISAKKGIIKMDVKIEATLVNWENEIIIGDKKIDAGKKASTKIVELLIKPYLNSISAEIQKKVEEKENIKVEKIWIEDGQLKAL